MDIKRVNQEIAAVEKTLRRPRKVKANEKLHVGVDLGTAYTVVTVLGENYRPLACKMKFAQVIRDGLVVDFLGAKNIVAELKKEIEKELQVSLTHAAIAVPPGTSKADSMTHSYVVEGAEMEVTNILDEPTASNEVLQITDGAVVDIGGGTTGVSVFKNGEVVHVGDQPSGGTHLSLVLAGNYGVSFEQAEEIKKDPKKAKEVFPIVRPVFDKMASIVEKEIQGQDVDIIYLVGGTCMMPGIEDVFEKNLGIKVVKPDNPLLVTPIGIAKSDTGESHG